MESIEKAVDKVAAVVFWTMMTAYFLIFLAFLAAIGTVMHIIEHRTRYAGIAAGILWLIILLR